MPTTALKLNHTEELPVLFKLRWVVIGGDSQPDTDLSSRDEFFASMEERFDRGRSEAASEVLKQS